jgi:hypothetical protein
MFPCGLAQSADERREPTRPRWHEPDLAADMDGIESTVDTADR